MSQSHRPNDTSQLKQVQLKHLLLDVDFFEKPKIKALLYDYGHAGVLLFVAILCDMSKGTNSEIPDSCIKQIAKDYDLNGKPIEEYIQYLITYDLIHRCSNPLYLANRRVIQDQTNMREKQDKWKKAKRRQRESIETSAGHVNNEYMNSEDRNIENRKSEEGKVKILDFLYFDEISLDTWKVKLGDKFDRTCEKLNGWIGEARGTPEYQQRLAKGRNAAFTIQNWVARAVTSEATPQEAQKSKNKTFLENKLKQLKQKELENGN